MTLYTHIKTTQQLHISLLVLIGHWIQIMALLMTKKVPFESKKITHTYIEAL
jgi:hypothetical protein